MIVDGGQSHLYLFQTIRRAAMRGVYRTASVLCKYKEERLGQEVLREERLNRRTRLFKAEVC